MLRLLRFLIFGVWPAAASNRSLHKRLQDLEARQDYLEGDLRKLRGRLTGGIRYDRAGVPIALEDELEDDSDFPDEAFNKLERQLRSGKEPDDAEVGP